MDMIKRIYDISELIKPGKVLIIYGPRRVGKTTLLKEFIKSTALKYRLDSGDNIRVREILGSQDFKRINEYTENYQLIAIDEAQQIPDIGAGLKIIVDNAEGIYVIATGSSSFELAGATGEPLTGRKRTVTLYPVSQKELLSVYNRYDLKERLEDFLIFGSYPEVITSKNRNEKIEILDELVNSYLLKDVLSLDRIKSSRTLMDILRLLAFQVGGLVSHHEIATSVKIDAKTVSRYLDLLEKTFVIKKICGYGSNLRKEITSKSKYYFVDNGVRNAVISQYNSLEYRNDTGQLWENFMVMERIKKHVNERKIPVSFYFWRTYDGKEVDLVEEAGGKPCGYEFKWSKNKKAPKEPWNKAYPDAEFFTVHKENYLDYV